MKVVEAEGREKHTDHEKRMMEHERRMDRGRMSLVNTGFEMKEVLDVGCKDRDFERVAQGASSGHWSRSWSHFYYRTELID